MIHELKTDPGVFEKSIRGEKKFEIRFNNREFDIGDILVLKETRYSGEAMKHGKPLEYTGREMKMEVRYIMHGPAYGLKEGWVIMS